jgi:hypothetical protein
MRRKSASSAGRKGFQSKFLANFANTRLKFNLSEKFAQKLIRNLMPIAETRAKQSRQACL